VIGSKAHRQAIVPVSSAGEHFELQLPDNAPRQSRDRGGLEQLSRTLFQRTASALFRGCFDFIGYARTDALQQFRRKRRGYRLRGRFAFGQRVTERQFGRGWECR